MVNRKVLLGLISVFLTGIALGGEAIPNWPAPTTWSPARAHSGLTAMGDVTGPLPFIGADPCRIADTRGNSFVGQYGPPSLSQGSPRNFTLTGQCGIPTSAGAVSLNVTVTNTQGPGFILIYPAGGSQPTVSTLNYVGGQTIANAAVVPLGAGGGNAGAITVIAGVSGTDLILDMNGYYTRFINPGPGFAVFGSQGGAGALWGANSSSLSESSGVLGIESSPTGLVFGVQGQTYSTSLGAAGIQGEAVASTGAVYGVYGFTRSTTGGGNGLPQGDAAGVFGGDSSGSPGGSDNLTAGVIGASRLNVGVVGISQNQGVVGIGFNSAGTSVAVGFLGFPAGGPNYGVYAAGNFGGTGAKYFVEPHPSDASKVIRYVSLEGPESGTYFRGTARTTHGEATIEVPESFRMVTDEEGLTVQLTPVGTLATLAVISQDLDQIVVRSSKDVMFHYLAQGVRRAFKDHQAISDGQEFMPRSAQERMPLYLTEKAKRRLISNGTYNADGTVNMETAERLGWVKMWAEREEQAKAAAAANAAAHAARWPERK